MNRMRRAGLGTVMMAALSLAAGCGGSAGTAPQQAKSPPPSASPEPQGEYGGGDAPSEPSDFGGEAESSADFDAAPSQASPGGSAAPSAPPRSEGRRAQEPSRDRSSDVTPQPAERPGLGTEWGETRHSRITTVPFVRADPSAPFATGSLFYNDEEGARAMANAAGFRRFAAGSVQVASGALAMSLRDERGGFLSGFVAGGKNYIVGEAGRRYTIVLKNRTPNRLEVIVSVDGLDVLDGKPAAFSKRGYLVEPRAELEIDGFRQSMDTVAAFRFGSVRGSYASKKHGDTRNVGVIGVAAFHERGTSPWTDDEVQRRQDANPFPGQFATPPGK